MIRSDTLADRLFHHDSGQVRKRYEEVKEKIAKKDPESFEKRFLSRCFISKQDIRDRIRFEDDAYFRFRGLDAMIDGMPLVKTLKRGMTIDFEIVSFRKLFSGNNTEAFSEVLMDQDEELQDLKSTYPEKKIESRVEFVYADEEEGQIRYLIGVYCDIDIDSLSCLFEKKCRLVDIGNEDLSSSISYCQPGEAVLLRKAGKRIFCSIDHVSISGYISAKQSKDLMEYLDDDAYLVIGEVSSRNDEYPYELSVRVRVFENPLYEK